MQVCGGNKPFVHAEIMSREHERCRQEAVDLFQSIRKMGGKEKSQKFLLQLEQQLDESFANYERHNAAKNFYASFQTPVTLIAVIVVLYLLKSLLEIVGLVTIANLCYCGMITVLIALVVWVYTRATGKFAEAGSAVDGAASFVQRVRWSVFMNRGLGLNRPLGKTKQNIQGLNVLLGKPK